MGFIGHPRALAVASDLISYFARVFIPELNITQNVSTESSDSVEQLFLKKYKDFYRLALLSTQ